jgi:hypothetical protein
MKYLVSFIFIVFVVCSCSNNKDNPNLKTCDSLFIILKSTDSTFKNIDWNMASEIEKNIAQDLITIQSTKKKLNTKQKELLESYKVISSFGKLNDSTSNQNAFSQSQNQRFLLKQIEYSFSQVKNLKSDIESESLKDDKIKEYISTESKAIEELYKFTTQKSEIYSACIEQYNNVKPQIDELINSKK